MNGTLGTVALRYAVTATASAFMVLEDSGTSTPRPITVLTNWAGGAEEIAEIADGLGGLAKSRGRIARHSGFGDSWSSKLNWLTGISPSASRVGVSSLSFHLRLVRLEEHSFFERQLGRACCGLSPALQRVVDNCFEHLFRRQAQRMRFLPVHP